MPREILIRALPLFSVVLAVAVAMPSSAQEQQKITKFDRERVLFMLHAIAIDVKKHYYDPTYHGVDWSRNTTATNKEWTRLSSTGRQ
jgi:hypothetical protein